MADFIFNIAKGRAAYYATLPAASDALTAILFKSSVEADGTLKDYTTFSTLINGTNVECNATNYVRKTLTSVTVSVDNSNDWATATAANITWSSLGGGTNNTLAKLVIGYVPDTGTSTDANIIPLWAYDLSATTDGNDMVVVVNASGLYKAS